MPIESDPPGKTSTRTIVASAALLFLLAIGLRFVHTRALLHGPIGTVLVQDAAYYHGEGVQRLVAGERPGAVSFMNLGYPYFLAAIYWVFGPWPAAAMWMQAVLGALTALIVALAASQLVASRTAAVAAGVLYAIYGPALFYEGLLLIPALANLLVAAALCSVAACRGRTSWWLPILAGLAVGFASLLRAGSLLYVPAIVPVVMLAGSSWRRGALRAAAFAGAVMVVVLPVIVTTGMRDGRWIPVSANGGMNFWVGNQRNAEGIYQAAEFVTEVGARGEEEGFLSEARRRTGRDDLDLVQSDRFWMREGLRDVRDHFGRWLGVEGRKLALFWNRHETRTNVGMEFVEQFSRVLERLPGFGVLAVLGLAGLAWLLAGGRLWPAAVVSVFILVPMAVCLLFFVSGEYRHPAAPPLCLAAAAPLDAAFRTLRRATRVPLLLGLVVGLVSVPLVVHRFPPLARTDHPRLDYANYAKALTTQGVPAIPRALVLLDRGRSIYGADPILLDATLRVQVLATVRGDDVDQARAAMRTAGQLQAWLAGPDAAAFPERFLQETFTDLGRGMAAVVRSPAVASDPGLLRAGALLGGHGYAEVDALVRGGELDAAARFAQAALAQAPRSAPALTAMGRLAKARGNDSEAASWFRRAMSGWPRIPEPAIELARLFASSGDTPHERLALEDALRRQPGNAAALEMLAALPR